MMRKPKRILVAGDDLAIRDATNGNVIVATMESRSWAGNWASSKSHVAVRADHAELVRVMAAAPEMMMILKSVLRGRVSCRSCGFGSSGPVRRRIESVIRKAEGKS